MITFEEVFTYEHLYASYLKCLLGVSWKGSVQAYDNHAPCNIYKTYKQVYDETFKTGRFHYFTIMERGKLRHIKSVSIGERVVQRCLCDYCLVPILSKYFIYDNCACIKEKGVHFAQNRMKYFLQKGFKKYKTNEFYILQYDFHHFFDTIPHDKLIEAVSTIIQDKKLIRLYSQLVNDFEGGKGLGLGSQISQISALFYPKDMDHYFKHNPKLLAYGRYMDDGFMISNDKEELLKCKKELLEWIEKLGLEPNMKKIQLKKVKGGFEYLKIRYFLTKTGKVVMKPNRKNITRNRRKLRKMFVLNIDFKDIDNFVKMVVGNLKHYDSYHTILNFQRDFKKLKEVYL